MPLLLFLLVAGSIPVNGQYFGRNKVQYEDFEFQVFETDHYEIYFYPEERRAVEDAGRMAERWYTRHSRTFLHNYDEKKPVIFYANDVDFQQTNVIRGAIGQGVGGVTEALKERVVMPLTGSYKATNHVLGHELVHSFQYDIALNSDSIEYNLRLLPLWFVEGMAEYLSIGRIDTHTAMWLRDALLRDDLPTIEQMTTDLSYFPYRYGQAYMAYIGGKYGDAAIAELFTLSGQIGVDTALVYSLGVTADSLSAEWISSVRQTYLPLMQDRVLPEEAGRLVLGEETTGGRINISPVLSPDGRYVSFLSERDIFNINLFIADSRTGEVIDELQATSVDSHIDALRFINSAGTWSPDSRRLAFITFVQGDNEIAIWNRDSGEIEERISVQGVAAMTNPAWSPDGRYIAFSGIDGGISDLYVLDLQTSGVRQLTNDRYSDLQPAWSPDGETIALVTDRGPEGSDFEILDFANPRLALVDVATAEIEVRRPFGDALHHNPTFSAGGESLFFISDQDGFKDIYRMEIATGDLYRVTELATGVSGITELSPAMTVARGSGEMMFSVYSNNAYQVYALSRGETDGEPVAARREDAIPVASILPPIGAVDEGLVAGYLDHPRVGLPGDISPDAEPYSASLQLDAVAPPSVGVQVGGIYGNSVVGGVAFFFSDMLGNHNLTLVAQANGSIKDVGGKVSYVNLDNRINYGATAAHIPYRSAFYGGRINTARGPANTFILRRIYIDNVLAGAYYPFTTTRRVEASAGFVRYGFDYDVQLFPLFGGQVEIIEDASRFGFEEPSPLYFFNGGVAYVGDYSNFGFTSPLQGGRYRVGLSALAGTQTFSTLLLDYRRYHFLNPVTFAYRVLHIGNYGASLNEETLIGVESLGSRYYPGFIRGYNFTSFDGECFPEGAEPGEQGCPAEDRLIGTRIAMGSVELRVPLLGTETLGLVRFPYLPTQLALFADGGVTWTAEEAPVLTFDRRSNERTPVFSAGASLRLNVLGYIIVEGYAAYPFQRPDLDSPWQFGFILRPGW